VEKNSFPAFFWASTAILLVSLHLSSMFRNWPNPLDARPCRAVVLGKKSLGKRFSSPLVFTGCPYKFFACYSVGRGDESGISLCVLYGQRITSSLELHVVARGPGPEQGICGVGDRVKMRFASISSML